MERQFIQSLQADPYSNPLRPVVVLQLYFQWHSSFDLINLSSAPEIQNTCNHHNGAPKIGSRVQTRPFET